MPGVGNNDSVPAMLTPGEIVLNPQESEIMRQSALSGGAGDTYNITVLATDADSFDKRWKDSFLRMNKGDAQVRTEMKRRIKK